MENWDEIRTAYQVAHLGTVSAAAEVLGVHHATVIRHVDALERRLGTKLFQRHARGYTPTEAGRDLLSVARTTEEQFAQLASRIRGLGETVQGGFTVTTIAGLAGLLVPVLAEFRRRHPAVLVNLETGTRLFRLDYGEAHVAIRAGSSPAKPDNVVQPLIRMRTGLYAARSYAAAHGLPRDAADLAGHRFIAAEGEASRAPFNRWLEERVEPQAIAFRSNEPAALAAALHAGMGIGFLTLREAREYPHLVEVLPPLPEWEAPLWIVTHVDLHRTRKVQAFVTLLREAARGWAQIEGLGLLR